LRNTGRPSFAAAWTWKTRFAKSIPMIVAFSMDAFSAMAGHATLPAWHTSMPSAGGIHPIKTQSAGTRFAQTAAIARRCGEWVKSTQGV
jgi:hypothetical protein